MWPWPGLWPQNSARLPKVTARYVFLTCRLANAAISAVSAMSVFATAMTPDVPTSSRCTTPGRCGALGSGAAGKASAAAKAPVRPTPRWCSTPFSRVPFLWPGPGCTTTPGGLFTISKSESSCSTSKGTSSGSSARVLSFGRKRTSTSSPRRKPRKLFFLTWPLTRTAPFSIRVTKYCLDCWYLSDNNASNRSLMVSSTSNVT
mmetsp:Transcript_83954/g.237824  ORF Transcript_83954/g.237824 Transcript_83954/m.237824 type:complete len:203 (+) Transcript_83954:106-714(+)